MNNLNKQAFIRLEQYREYIGDVNNSFDPAPTFNIAYLCAVKDVLDELHKVYEIESIRTLKKGLIARNTITTLKSRMLLFIETHENAGFVKINHEETKP